MPDALKFDTARDRARGAHTIDRARVHHVWDNALEPALTVESGDVVELDLVMASHGQVHEGSTAADVSWDPDTAYSLAGPVFVQGARPGAALQVDVLALTPGDWGWTAIMPGLGLLPEDFPRACLRTFDLRRRSELDFAPGITVPIRPFLGTMGVAIDEPGRHSPFPPHKGAGNIDNRHLGVGSSLFVPVWCEGALFSCGDPHAGQGDGEVCVSAVECDMRATLRLTVHERPLSAPMFRTAPGSDAALGAAGFHGTIGVSGDLYEGAQIAVRTMVEWLVAEHGLGPEDAYMLSSIVGDLKIHEIVDAGVWTVGFTMPLAIFARGAERATAE